MHHVSNQCRFFSSFHYILIMFIMYKCKWRNAAENMSEHVSLIMQVKDKMKLTDLNILSGISARELCVSFLVMVETSRIM